jgi:hypothetical protein
MQYWPIVRKFLLTLSEGPLFILNSGLYKGTANSEVIMKVEATKADLLLAA